MTVVWLKVAHIIALSIWCSGLMAAAMEEAESEAAKRTRKP